MKRSILILCTGNSCRSQMAEGFLKALDPELIVHSAGTSAAREVNPKAIQVMKEEGIDLSGNVTKNVDRFLHEPFDYVITVCDHAKETCPLFIGKVGKRLHLGFEDPADAKGTEEEILDVFRRVRNEIKSAFTAFYHENIRTNNHA